MKILVVGKEGEREGKTFDVHLRLSNLQGWLSEV